MIVVLDTNVIVSALRSPSGASFAILSALPSKKFTTAISVALRHEYLDVVHRPGLIPSGVSYAQKLATIQYIVSISTHHTIHYLWRTILPDANDAMVLEVAIAAGASYIVTHNVKDFHAAASFGIAAITPGQFIQKIGGLP